MEKETEDSQSVEGFGTLFLAWEAEEGIWFASQESQEASRSCELPQLKAIEEKGLSALQPPGAELCL